MSETTGIENRYIGGTKNLDGAVTRTVGVTAKNLDDGRRRIAERLTEINKRLGYDEVVTPAQVGVVRVRTVRS